MSQEQRLARVRDELAAQADVFDDPSDYLAGVDDALERVRRASRSDSARRRPGEPGSLRVVEPA